ncbi:glycosyltransferase family 2 protein [Roseibacillus ishigakijimensis]|uniref:Glycosyltransferase family 2 protein n=1 Tax=Roseibacillus ishigakijimensis TaxID=454146 RepID=A0A934RSJ4_9BACT|nr:glycosyltransferase family 2 protein [Roseibacillus ishigakijimensis]MBK1835137.1 glycosyltransferase family 2 protein [Roseibacillus ishigakijimensis]
MKLSTIAIDTVSFVIPAMNEEATLETLYQGIASQMKALGHDFEVIFIDDGSTDRTWSVMEELALRHRGLVRAYRFRRNMGKADALSLGYERASGEVIFTMDADLQDDPQEIPRFLAKIQEGYGIVTGYKKKRYDPWHKVLPSRVFNAVLSKLVGVDLHDHNCGFKAYRREVAKQLPMYGEMHRMVPSLASFEGYETAELVVQHHPRQFGQSKYGVKRILCGIFDMTTVSFLKTYRNRPMHFFGRIALLGGVAAATLLTLAAVCALLGHSTSLFLAVTGMLAAMTALLSVGMGLQLEHGVYKNMKEYHAVPVAENTDAKVFSPRILQEEASLIA